MTFNPKPTEYKYSNIRPNQHNLFPLALVPTQNEQSPILKKKGPWALKAHLVFWN